MSLGNHDSQNTLTPSIGVRGVETTEGLSAAFVKSSELVVCL